MPVHNCEPVFFLLGIATVLEYTKNKFRDHRVITRGRALQEVVNESLRPSHA